MPSDKESLVPEHTAEKPASISRRKFATFRGVSSIGCFPTFSAKFSEWIPNASKPRGSKTVCPCWRRNRPWMSAPVKANRFPTCSPSADGYGNIMSW